MNENTTVSKLVGVTVTVAIVIIMVATLLVPVVSDAQEIVTEKEGINESYQHRMAIVDSATIIYGHESGEVVINASNKEYSYDATQDAMVCYFHSDACWIEEDRSTPTAPVISFIAGTNNIFLGGVDWTLICDGATISLTYGTPETTIEVPKGEYTYVYDPEGEYIYARNTDMSGVNIGDNAESIVLVMRGWWGNSYNSSPFIKADLDSAVGINATKNTGASPSTVVQGVLMLDSTDHGNGTVSINPSATFMADGSSESVSDLGIIAPLKYAYYESNGTSAILSVIPVLIIVSLFVFAVNAIRLKNE